MLNKWHTKAIDFDEACTQADCGADVYLHQLAGFHVNDLDRHTIKLIKILHGMRQEGCNFYEEFKSELENEPTSNQQLILVLSMQRAQSFYDMLMISYCSPNPED